MCPSEKERERESESNPGPRPAFINVMCRQSLSEIRGAKFQVEPGRETEPGQNKYYHATQPELKAFEKR